MTLPILTEVRDEIGFITLNKPHILNAWDRPMRDLLVNSLDTFEADPAIKAIILTGAGDRAFGAGQDLNETKTFDSKNAEDWIEEWRRLYGTIRSLTKPLVCALNGLAAGSAFQVALLADLRVGHAEVKMGQPEINSGLPTATGSWIMRELIGLSRTIDLTLTGRMVLADECLAMGLLSRIVPKENVMDAAIVLARELGEKAPIAMRLNKRRFQEMTEASFQETMSAASRIHSEAYGTGEPSMMMERFLKKTERKG